MAVRVQAIEDASLSATVVSRVPLPGVRAGSGLAWLGGRLAIVQDDAPAIALVDPETMRIEHRPLGAGGWDKATKLDLEACVVDGDRLFAFGSGSTPLRERIAVVDGGARIVEASALYAALRARTDFAGSELNVEGAVLVDGVLRLFQRGNGAAKDGRAPVDATCDLAWGDLDLQANVVPEIRNVVDYDLGRMGDVRLTFTDAAASDGGVLYLAVAEDSPDTYRDGPVRGVAFGRIDARGARFACLRDADGRPFVEKAEGLAASGRGAFVVLDRDDPGTPAELCRVELTGF